MFHWVPNQKNVLEGIYNNLNSGGHLLFCVPAKCDTNTSIISNELIVGQKWADHFKNYDNNRSYHNLQEYETMCLDIGYQIQYMEAFDTQTIFDSLTAIENWIKPISPYIEHLPNVQLKDEFLRDVMEILCRNKIETNCDGKFVLKSSKIIGFLTKI